MLTNLIRVLMKNSPVIGLMISQFRGKINRWRPNDQTRYTTSTIVELRTAILEVFFDLVKFLFGDLTFGKSFLQYVEGGF